MANNVYDSDAVDNSGVDVTFIDALEEQKLIPNRIFSIGFPNDEINPPWIDFGDYSSDYSDYDTKWIDLLDSNMLEWGNLMTGIEFHYSS